jgi:hypothetical protein
MSTMYNFESVLGSIQENSMCLLDSHLKAMRVAMEAGDITSYSKLAKDLKGVMYTADVTNAIRLQISIDAAHKFLSSQGYILFKNPAELIAHQKKQKEIAATVTAKAVELKEV